MRRAMMPLGALMAAAGLLAVSARAQAPAPEPFTVATDQGELTIHPLIHGSVRFSFKGKQIYVDPWSRVPKLASLPKADLILITHEHGDHCDAKAVATLKKPGTIILANGNSVKKLGLGQVMKNGDKRTVVGVTVEAVPAYNLKRGPKPGQLYHPKGRDNGYVITFGNKRVYLAGDTEGVPEMANLKKIDIAFLPINLPYTMPPLEAVAAARLFRPGLLIPYHQGSSDPQEVAEALAGTDYRVKVIALP